MKLHKMMTIDKEVIDKLKDQNISALVNSLLIKYISDKEPVKEEKAEMLLNKADEMKREAEELIKAKEIEDLKEIERKRFDELQDLEQKYLDYSSKHKDRYTEGWINGEWANPEEFYKKHLNKASLS